MASSTRQRRPDHSLLRTLAALLGSVPVALGSGLSLALLLPLDAPARYLVGSFSVFPIWTGVSLWTLLAADARRAWLGVLAASLVLGLLSAAGLGLRGSLGAAP
jgi:hypothetical protein